MFRVLVIFAVVSLGIVSISAQTNQFCPTISVNGPAGITVPGDPMEFVANVSGPLPYGFSYEWTVSVEGKIIAGQGTRRVQIQTPKKSSFNITARFEVKGLPAGCENNASETAPVACMCTAILLAEYGSLSPRQELSRLDNAVTEFQQRENSKLYFIEYFRRRTTDRQIQARIRWISNYLIRQKGVAQGSLEIITDSYDEKRTKIYVVPPGADNPAP